MGVSQKTIILGKLRFLFLQNLKTGMFIMGREGLNLLNEYELRGYTISRAKIMVTFRSGR